MQALGFGKGSFSGVGIKKRMGGTGVKVCACCNTQLQGPSEKEGVG